MQGAEPCYVCEQEGAKLHLYKFSGENKQKIGLKLVIHHIYTPVPIPLESKFSLFS